MPDSNRDIMRELGRQPANVVTLCFGTAALSWYLPELILTWLATCTFEESVYVGRANTKTCCYILAV